MSGLQGPLPLSSPMAAGSYVPAPAAWFRLLRQFPDLDPAAAVFEPVRLTVARAAQLIKVNKEVNTALRYRDDAAEDRWEIGWRDRKSVVEGKSVSVRVDLGGRRSIKKKKNTKNYKKALQKKLTK